MLRIIWLLITEDMFLQWYQTSVPKEFQILLMRNSKTTRQLQKDGY